MGYLRFIIIFALLLYLGTGATVGEAQMAPVISASSPPSGFIDSLEDQHGASGDLRGLTDITITFSEMLTKPNGAPLNGLNFSPSYTRNGEPVIDPNTNAIPSLSLVSGSGAGPYLLRFNPRIPPGAWTKITVVEAVNETGVAISPSGNSIVIGFLPMDLTQSGTVSGDDIERWRAIYHNEYNSARFDELQFIDQNRDGLINSDDIWRSTQLMAGIGTFNPWAGYDIGPVPQTITCDLVVSPTGNDSAPGTPSLPWRTLSKAGNTATAGQTVCIKPGLYRESLDVRHSGTSDLNRVTFRAYPGAECSGPKGEPKSDRTPGDAHGKCAVRLDGSQVINGTWTRCASQSACGGNAQWQAIYFLDLPAGFTKGISKDWLFEDEKRLKYASDPNQPLPYFTWSEMDIPQQFTMTSLRPKNDHANRPNGYWTGGYLKVRDEYSEKYYRKIDSFESGIMQFSPLSEEAVESNRYILLNHLALLDEPGEFVITYGSTPERLYLMTTDRQSPASHAIAFSKLPYAIDLNGRDYVTIEGLDISKYTGGEIIFISDHGDPEVMSGLRIRNNYLHHNGDGEGLGSGTTIYARGQDRVQDFEVENNEIYESLGIAISMGPLGARIAWNNFHRVNDAIRAGGTNVVVEHNHFYDSFETDGHQDGLDLDRVRVWKIRYNTISDFTQLLYFHSNDGGIHEQIQIYGNVLYSNRYGAHGGDSPGIAMGNGVDVFIHSNTCGWLGPANNGYRCIQIEGNVTNVRIRNNVAFDSYFMLEPSSGQINSDYNWFSRPDRTDGGPNSRSGIDPQFMNYVRHSSWDFRLKSTSPLIDVGDPNLPGAFTIPPGFADILLTPRPRNIPGVGRDGAGTYDIGAFER